MALRLTLLAIVSGRRAFSCTLDMTDLSDHGIALNDRAGATGKRATIAAESEQTLEYGQAGLSHEYTLLL